MLGEQSLAVSFSAQEIALLLLLLLLLFRPPES
jgi:hypothetical protein